MSHWSRLIAGTMVAALAGSAAPLHGQAPHSASATGKLRVAYTDFTLPNGLHVILHRDASVPTVAVNVWYHVGSGSEKPGRTGFAHLFEHLMFEGSKNVAEGAFDQWLEAAGGNNNGSTSTDRTNYYIDIPSNALELALFLESDRMGYLLDTMTRRARRMASATWSRTSAARATRTSRTAGRSSRLFEMLYPTEHPYSWPTIGSMEDLSAATPAGRRGLLQDLLRAEQREPRHRRRHRRRRDAHDWSRNGSARFRAVPTCRRSRRRRRISPR